MKIKNKQLIILFFTVIVCLVVFPNKVNAASKTETLDEGIATLGDINQDKKINIQDVLKLRRYIAYTSNQTIKNKYENWNLTEEEKKVADINQDNGKINLADVLKLRRYIAANSNKTIAKKHPEWLWLFRDYIIVKTDEAGGNTYSRDEIKSALDSIYIPQNSPLRNNSDVLDSLEYIQKEYKVDPIFAIAVAIVESNAGTVWGVIDPGTNNIFNIKSNNGLWKSYSSVDEAIKDFGNLIANSPYYFKSGKISVKQIGPIYCEGEWTHLTAKHMKELIDFIK